VSTSQVLTQSESRDVWKGIALFLGGVVLSLVGCIWNMQKDSVTKADLTIALAAQQRQLDDQSIQLSALRTSIIQLEVDTGRISEHLGVPAHPAATR
jgi:hypothetical protein